MKGLFLFHFTSLISFPFLSLNILLLATSDFLPHKENMTKTRFLLYLIVLSIRE